MKCCYTCRAHLIHIGNMRPGLKPINRLLVVRYRVFSDSLKLRKAVFRQMIHQTRGTFSSIGINI